MRTRINHVSVAADRDPFTFSAFSVNTHSDILSSSANLFHVSLVFKTLLHLAMRPFESQQPVFVGSETHGTGEYKAIGGNWQEPGPSSYTEDPLVRKHYKDIDLHVSQSQQKPSQQPLHLTNVISSPRTPVQFASSPSFQPLYRQDATIAATAPTSLYSWPTSYLNNPSIESWPKSKHFPLQTRYVKMSLKHLS
ncbi:hypothetical protein BDP27DRAFT_1430294 [Rhodocollybia butyracea]|uniref:Uncharacterized protein n=1 Tax=Rhodocollybia butyracea TaxID=206335 RepID=A0A9P5TZG8_9AGAR|nr:hypothetical protein BDP27DRAFT_1430294 [Rhodocollybia butyracea]